ncbi:baseplate J/gp47 family protein [Bosea sp. MMO-172]|uniref:baseplate J/gp47 family protein n=1 Tax=Bosea sp. MMO-172 TaxID=3127885 RepID=UPI00301B51D7
MTTHSVIDLSRVPAPDAIEALDFETLLAQFKARFLAWWEIERERDPTLPAYDVPDLETDPVIIVGQAWSYLRLLDRQRVNDGVRAVFAPLARGNDLDVVAARQNVQRLEISAGVFESDAQLLNRYLLSFGRASAGSADRLLFDAYTAWPAMLDARVNGWAVHGRRGEIDLVIAGPGGPTPPDKIALVRAAVTAASAKPEAIGVFVLAATVRPYSVEQTLRVPVGPDAELVRLEAVARVRSVADARASIGATVQRDHLAGAAFGPSIVSAAHLAPTADVVCSAYEIPICSNIDTAVEVAS